MNPIAVTAVQAMVAPVVLITTAAILSGALLTMYGSVNDRMRVMDQERLEILAGADGTLAATAVSPVTAARYRFPDRKLTQMAGSNQQPAAALLRELCVTWQDYVRWRDTSGWHG